MTKKKHILFVDDEAGNRLSFKAYFRRNFSVILASDAAEAKQIIEAIPITVALSDQRMPGMSGLNFFAWLKKYDERIARILVSGSIKTEEKEVALGAGLIHAWVQKPWNVEELELMLKDCCRLD